MAAVGVWWRTLRHLKFQQIVGRTAFKLHAPRPDFRGAPQLRAMAHSWKTSAAKDQSLVGSHRWRFLNVEREISPDTWTSADADRLWLYNLHYFDDLNARGADDRAAWHRKLLSEWIEANPAGKGTGWEPYPVSLRCVNWIKWFLRGAAPERRWLDSLAVQTRWLRRRLEYHLLGNHLFVNAKALVFAGLFFEGGEADEWLRIGAQIIESELDEQFLSDGGQFERSPMYHALALEDVLDLVNICRALGDGIQSVEALEPQLRAKAARMLSWLRAMVHADGRLALFNDCADGVAPPVDELLRYARRLEIEVPESALPGVTTLAPSGYVRVARGRATAWLDVAPLGPDYLLGHAHADSLSFELSLDGARVIANGGTSCYGTGPRRAYERGTAAHNTVEVAGQNSSEVWAGFRVGRRAKPRDLDISDSAIRCSHDGYTFLPGMPVHTRRWGLADTSLTVDDTVVPAAEGRARYFLAPDLHAKREGERRWVVLRADTAVMRAVIESGNGSVERIPQAQRFGVVTDVDCIVVTLTEGRARTVWSWV
jgi:uncharacterized heparinase superfamily protein